MPGSPITTLSSPLSDLETVDFSADSQFVESLLQASIQSLYPPPAATKAKINPLQESQVTKKTEPESRSKSKINSTEQFPRRRSTRLSTIPNRFQPEVRNHNLANIPKSELPSTTLKNTSAVNSTGDNPTRPVNIVRLTKDMSSFAAAESIVDPPEPAKMDGEVSPIKTSTAEDRTEAASLNNDRGRHLKQGKQDIPMAESTDGSIVEASPAPPKRYHKKKRPAARKQKATVKKPIVPSGDSTSYPSSDTSIRTRKRSPSEEPAERSYKKIKSEHRKSLVVETSARRTRSQNASASANPVGSPPAAETQVPRKPATKTRSVKSPAAKTTYTPPRLSAMNFLAPLRAMMGSAIIHYSSLPKNLTDVDAIANLYRTFCALDTYQKHLKILGLEGDDKDVRGIMKQVWRLVDGGEIDEGVVWKTLVATWSTQGTGGWGNDGRV